MIWQIGEQRFDMSRALWLMGILNVTPDSFSDGGRYETPHDAIERARQMVKAGAKIIDVGGESTRPGAAKISVEEELARVLPVITVLRDWPEILISIDTYRQPVASAAVVAGAQIVNDISGGRFDDKMLPFVAETGVGYVMMHIQGTPETMQQNPVYDDVIHEIYDYFRTGLDRARNYGMRSDQIVLDPGIGFGKTLEHNVKIFQSLKTFQTLGRPLLVGASRKSFIDKIFPSTVENRLPGSLAAALGALQEGARILRVHDVVETQQAVQVFQAIRRDV
ncbi:MAG: dihydropteroate synthase [Lentisphaeria bacterium]|nr:dihydropteroate synthase [Candidatus Neomarinimicrobiota bacterium]MCF7841538.1 dihydropteroate synthase [Lentisphaeria bacterium]